MHEEASAPADRSDRDLRAVLGGPAALLIRRATTRRATTAAAAVVLCLPRLARPLVIWAAYSGKVGTPVTPDAPTSCRYECKTYIIRIPDRSEHHRNEAAIAISNDARHHS